MDEALDVDNSIEHITKGQEAWRTNLATMLRQCPICNQKKGINFFPTQLHLNPPCLECKHAWNPSGIKYDAIALKVIHGKTPIRLLGIRYNMWLDSAAQRRYVMDGITENGLLSAQKQGPLHRKWPSTDRLHSRPPFGLLGAGDNLAGERI